MNGSEDALQKLERLERRLRAANRKITALAVFAAAAVAVGCASLATAQAPVLRDGVLHARGIVITDARGVERIHIGAPVPDAPNEGGRPRIAESTGMIIHDENGRERWGVGLLGNGVLSMGFDAAPGVGSGANRERLHLGVTPTAAALSASWTRPPASPGGCTSTNATGWRWTSGRATPPPAASPAATSTSTAGRSCPTTRRPCSEAEKVRFMHLPVSPIV